MTQGVHVHLGDKGVTVQPTRRRVLKLQAIICEVLDTDFLAQAVFGAVGRAAIQPIHKRAACTDANLTPKLVDALLASAALLDHIQPRFVPYGKPRSTQATIFADAFSVDRGRHIKAGHVPDDAGRHQNQRRRNGWGYVVQIDEQVFYDFGEAPAWFLDVFAERKAFICALGILAQILAITTFAARLPLTLDGLHRQRRRPVRPHQGLRQQRRRQRHGGNHVGAGSRTGMGTPLRTGAVG